MNNISKRPNTIDEVIIKKDQVVSGTVVVPDGVEGLVFGTPLTSIDGGLNWTSQERDVWVAGESSTDDEVFHDGHSYKSLEDANSNEPVIDDPKWQHLGEFDANGILGENITETSKVSVVVTGSAREKHLVKYDGSMRPSLFKNKIILK